MFNLLKRAFGNEADEAHARDADSDAPLADVLTDYELVANVQTDVGCIREGNEDNGRYVNPSDAQMLAAKGVLLIVCDGMGGHSSGEVASSIAVETISREYYASKDAPPTALKRAVEQANRAINQAAQADEALRGMGTTCTALALCQGLAYNAHVGDSRLYMLREGEIYLLTEDHSAVMEMVKAGIISMAEARHHTDKNVILRALGTSPQVEVAAWDAPLAVRAGDQFLLCSDGLYDLVEDDEIKQALLPNDPHEACAGLIALAKQRGGHDNITVGILSIRPAGYAETQTLRVTREVEVAL